MKTINFKAGAPASHGAGQDAFEDLGEAQQLKIDLDIIKKYSSAVRFEIVGFTDSRECDREQCLALSNMRAELVYAWLLSNGAKADALVLVGGHGADLPIDDNSTEEGRARNRRVEVNVLP